MTKKALVIAIDTYPNSPLRGCVNDANRISKILSSENCNFEVRRLTNEKATRVKIREELIWLAEDADTSLLFFAGHGWRRPTGTYLVSHDSVLHDEGIELQWLGSVFKKLCSEKNNLVIILDACHSGDGTIRNLKSRAEDIEVDDLKILSIAGNSKFLMAACKGPEVALEISDNGTIHGAFSHYLCCALEGYASDSKNEVTLNAAFDYVSVKLRDEGRQTPVLRGDQEGQFVLAENVAKKGEWKQINSKGISLKEALVKAEELLSFAQSAMASVSFDDWRRKDFILACQVFEPVLLWFRRRKESQPELLNNREFREKFLTCVHMHKQLCAVSPGISLPNGTLKENIGGGSFGNVWTIEGGKWDGPVCFKSYHAHDILDAQKDARFRRGYQAMHQLDHPNIVKVIKLTEVPFGFFMDYVQGANLRRLNPGPSLEPELIVNLLIEIAETLQHAHGRGVIHRDVKPENIVVHISDENKYSAFLTDFDLAWFSAATQVTKVADGFGSHYYAAPEQINAPQSSVAHKATVDVYAFGQLCFFCVCGRDPMAFDTESNAFALSESLGRVWNDARASTEMLKLYKECVIYNPSKRIQDFRSISERLSRLNILLNSKSEEFTFERVLEQLAYALTGKIEDTQLSQNSKSIRSRSNRTGINLMLLKDAPDVCGIEVYFHPNSLLIEGRKAADVRALVNGRIDAMLSEFKRDHDAARKGNKVGAFEFSIRIDRISKDQDGVLLAKNIISRTVDLLEQA